MLPRQYDRTSSTAREPTRLHQSSTLSYTVQPIPRVLRPQSLLPKPAVVARSKEKARLEQRMQNHGIDEEEQEILRSIEERNNNRRQRHANRREVNSLVRVQTNDHLTQVGLLGMSPEVRVDSVIAWESSVKTPLRAKQEQHATLPPTPLFRHSLSSTPPTSQTCVLQPVTDVLNMLAKERHPQTRSILISRLASDFCSYFFQLHSEEIQQRQLVPQLKDAIEVECLRTLRDECQAEDIKFFIYGLLQSIPNLSAILNGHQNLPSRKDDGSLSEFAVRAPPVPTPKRRLIVPQSFL